LHINGNTNPDACDVWVGEDAVAVVHGGRSEEALTAFRPFLGAACRAAPP
jgi:hypothetical protein